MAIKKIKGDDIRVVLTVKVNGVAQVISELNDIAVFGYQNKNSIKTKVATFVLEPTGTEMQLNVVDDEAGQISVVFPRTLTKGMSTGIVLAEIRLQFHASAEYISSVSNNGQDKFELFELGETSSTSVLV